jgi:hypothetical protein
VFCTKVVFDHFFFISPFSLTREGWQDYSESANCGRLGHLQRLATEASVPGMDGIPQSIHFRGGKQNGH